MTAPGGGDGAQDPAADAGPKVPGLEPTFRHLDDPDVPWQQVRAVRLQSLGADSFNGQQLGELHEVNPGHLALLPAQRQRRGWSGSILTNPNCTTTVLVMALAPLHEAFGVETVLMTSMQAVSGAGYPGVASLDIMGNIIPYIGGEEAKVEVETGRLLGTVEDGLAVDDPMTVSALCYRAPVLEGHTESVSVRLRGNPSPEQVREALAAWTPLPQRLDLPSAPRVPIRLHTADNRPQVRRDVELDGGMSVHVGRIRKCPVLGIKFTLLGHNTERGAAGGSILNAELAVAQGMVGQ